MGTVHFTCRANGTCDTFDLQWYGRKNYSSSDHDNIVMIESGVHNEKYCILKINGGNSDGTDCHISSTLIIYNFNQSDNGYYWCQIIANSCPLQPSPHQYTAVNEAIGARDQMCQLNHYLFPPLCAENDTSSIISDDNSIGCLSLSSSKNLIMAAMATSTATVNISYSTYYHNTTTSTITSQDNEGHVTFERKESMTWLYYGSAMIVLLFIIFVLVLSVVVMGIKFRTKQSKHY